MLAASARELANPLVQTDAAARLVEATVLLTGVSAGIARTFVTLGVDLGPLHTLGDVQEGSAEAERVLGYEAQQRLAEDDTVSAAPASRPRRTRR